MIYNWFQTHSEHFNFITRHVLWERTIIEFACSNFLLNYPLWNNPLDLSSVNLKVKLGASTGLLLIYALLCLLCDYSFLHKNKSYITHTYFYISLIVTPKLPVIVIITVSVSCLFLISISNISKMRINLLIFML